MPLDQHQKGELAGYGCLNQHFRGEENTEGAPELAERPINGNLSTFIVRMGLEILGARCIAGLL